MPSCILLKSSEPSRDIVLRLLLAATTAAAVFTRGRVFVFLAFCACACTPGNGGTAGMEDLRRCSLRVLGRAPGPRALIASPSDALLARTVPASLRWNQLMKGLLDLRVSFFICDCVGSGSGLGDGGAFAFTELSFLDLTVGVEILRLRVAGALAFCVADW